MSISTITHEMLLTIENYAKDEYTLTELSDELNISMELLNDKQILQAFEKGLIQLYISKSSSGLSDEEIISDLEINAEQCTLWHKKYSTEVAKQRDEIRIEQEHTTKQFSDLTYSGLINVMLQNADDHERDYSQAKLGEDLNAIVKKMQAGDNTDLLTVLATNLMQMELFNGQITGKISSNGGKRFQTYEALSKMQMKILQESRKTVMCINEIVNPKRTTFVKNAEQHNYIHQNSEKKEESENEKQKHVQLEQSDEIPEAEVVPLQEKVK